MKATKPKLLTVTLNPAIDCFIRVKTRCGQEIPVGKPVVNAGGKGVNVSRVLTQFDWPSSAIGICAGESGREFIELAQKEDLKVKFVVCKGSTRTNYTFTDLAIHSSRRIIEPGPVVDKQTLSKFLKQYKRMLASHDGVIISGRNALGVEDDIYEKLIRCAKRQKKVTLLDASGKTFKKGVNAKPCIIKPNLEEAEEYFNKRLRSVKNQVQAIQKFHKKGISVVLLSLGKKGLLASNKKEILKAYIPKWEVEHAVGCGDALVAGFIYSILNGFDFSDAVQFSVATASMAGSDPQLRLTNKKNVLELMDKIVLKSI